MLARNLGHSMQLQHFKPTTLPLCSSQVNSADLESGDHDDASGTVQNETAVGLSMTISNPVYALSELTTPPIDNPMYASEQDKRSEPCDMLSTDPTEVEPDKVLNNPLYYSEIVSQDEAKESYSYAALHTAGKPIAKVPNHDHHRLSSSAPSPPQPKDFRDLAATKTHLKPGITSSYVLLGPDESEEGKPGGGVSDIATAAASDHCQVVSTAEMPATQRGRLPASAVWDDGRNSSRSSDTGQHLCSALGRRSPAIAVQKPEVPPKPIELISGFHSPFQSSLPIRQTEFRNKVPHTFSRSQSTRTSDTRHTAPAYGPIRYRKVKDNSNRPYSVNFLKALDDCHKDNCSRSVSSLNESTPQANEGDC